MAETSASGSPGSSRGKVLRRSNSSRLRMHAPSSIQVAPPSGCASEWKVAIPLLSPLDILSLPGPQRLPPSRRRRRSSRSPVGGTTRRVPSSDGPPGSTRPSRSIMSRFRAIRRRLRSPTAPHDMIETVSPSRPQ
ncbi:unnamed protein product [Spirodela intermedia]|uniref:Uncharacterized protein n=1 Tax=Spirodela intermedia TaxID=51605 RepID=A0A7I8ICG6_SPIIN|nr:unnamed protein product [Spirodela intermedia]CAA6655507.1 unnamed protein product [Spirodela intermedia]